MSPGQVQMVKQTKGYRMDVYPSHRNAGYPDWIEANIRKNAAGAAKLSKDGTDLLAADLPGILFPFPKDGSEIIWNFLMRYKGIGNEMPRTTTAVSPRPGSTEWLDPAGPQSTFYPWGKKGTNSLKQASDLMYCIDFGYDSPAALAGQRIFICDYTNKDREAFFYFPGQRRVRRLPAYTYDAPQIGFENQYPLDTAWVFLGTSRPVRLENRRQEGDVRPVQQLRHVRLPEEAARRAPAEAPGQRRPPVRTAPGVGGGGDAEEGDAAHHAEAGLLFRRGHLPGAHRATSTTPRAALWKVEEGYPIPIWELGGTFDHFPFVAYDLVSGRYVCDQSTIGTGKDMLYHVDSNSPRFKVGLVHG